MHQILREMVFLFHCKSCIKRPETFEPVESLGGLLKMLDVLAINYNKSNCLDEDVLAHLFDRLSGTPCRMLNTKPRPFWAISKETLLITKHLR